MLAGEAGIEVAQLNAAQQQTDHAQPFEASTTPRIGTAEPTPRSPNRAAAAVAGGGSRGMASDRDGVGNGRPREGLQAESSVADDGSIEPENEGEQEERDAAAVHGAGARHADKPKSDAQPGQWREGIRGSIFLRQLKLAAHTTPEGMTQLGNAFWYGIKDTVKPNRTAAEQCWLSAVADHDFPEAHFNLGYLWVTSQAADAKNFTLSQRLETGRGHWRRCEPSVPCVVIGAVFPVVELGIRAADAIPASLGNRAGKAAAAIGDTARALLAELAASLSTSIGGIWGAIAKFL